MIARQPSQRNGPRFLTWLKTSEPSDTGRDDILFDGLDQRLDTRGSPIPSCDFIQISIGHSDVPTAHAKRPYDSPTNPVHHDLCAYNPVRKRQRNAISLSLVRKALLAKAIAKKPAKKRLPTSMADSTDALFWIVAIQAIG